MRAGAHATILAMPLSLVLLLYCDLRCSSRLGCRYLTEGF